MTSNSRGDSRINKHCVVFLLAAVGTLTAQTHPSVIGNGWGLDHVIVGAASPEVVKDVFKTSCTGCHIPSYICSVET